MSVCANFSFIASLQVAEKFVVVRGGFQVTSMSDLNPSCIEMELGLGFDNIAKLSQSPSWISVEADLSLILHFSSSPTHQLSQTCLI